MPKYIPVNYDPFAEDFDPADTIAGPPANTAKPQTTLGALFEPEKGFVSGVASALGGVMDASGFAASELTALTGRGIAGAGRLAGVGPIEKAGEGVRKIGDASSRFFLKTGDSAIKRGFKTVGSGLGIAKDVVTGDSQGAAELIGDLAEYRGKNPKSTYQQGMEAAIQGGKREDKEKGFFNLENWKEEGRRAKKLPSDVAEKFKRDWQEAPDIAMKLIGVSKNIVGTGELIAEQLPNSLAPMALQGVGALTGSLGGTLGSLAGGFFGASTGNAVTEMSGIIEGRLDEKGIDPKNKAQVAAYIEANRADILKEATIKGVVLGAFDILGAKLGFGILTRPIRKAEVRALTKMGVDMTDKAAVEAAAATPAFKIIMSSDAVLKKEMARPYGRIAASAAMEPVTETAGEFFGTGLSNGDWDIRNSLTEGLLAIGQSTGVTTAGKTYATIKEGVVGEGERLRDTAATETNKRILNLRRANLPTRDLIAIKNRPDLLTQVGIEGSDIDAILQERYNDMAMARANAPTGPISKAVSLHVARDLQAIEQDKARAEAQNVADREIIDTLAGEYEPTVPEIGEKHLNGALRFAQGRKGSLEVMRDAGQLDAKSGSELQFLTENSEDPYAVLDYYPKLLASLSKRKGKGAPTAAAFGDEFGDNTPATIGTAVGRDEKKKKKRAIPRPSGHDMAGGAGGLATPTETLAGGLYAGPDNLDIPPPGVETLERTKTGVSVETPKTGANNEAVQEENIEGKEKGSTGNAATESRPETWRESPFEAAEIAYDLGIPTGQRSHEQIVAEIDAHDRAANGAVPPTTTAQETDNGKEENGVAGTKSAQTQEVAEEKGQVKDDPAAALAGEPAAATPITYKLADGTTQTVTTTVTPTTKSAAAAAPQPAAPKPLKMDGTTREDKKETVPQNLPSDATHIKAKGMTEAPVASLPSTGVTQGARKITVSQQKKIDEAREMYRAAANNPDLVGKQRATTIANLRNLTQFWTANQPEKSETGYEHGNKVAYTGETTDDGLLDGLRKFIFLEGSDAGGEGWAATKEHLKASTERHQQEWKKQQEGFARPHKTDDNAGDVVSGQEHFADDADDYGEEIEPPQSELYSGPQF